MPNAPCPTDTQLIADLRAVVPQASAAWFYGSAARNALRPDSDIDVALLLPQAMTFAQKWDWTDRLGTLWKRDADVVDFVRTTSVLQQQILTTGRRLFCTDAAQVDSYEAFCRTEYLNLQARRGAQLAHILARGRVFS